MCCTLELPVLMWFCRWGWRMSLLPTSTQKEMITLIAAMFPVLMLVLIGAWVRNMSSEINELDRKENL